MAGGVYESESNYDFFISYTRQSQRREWAAGMFTQQLSSILQHGGKSCFYDASSLVAEDISTCLSHAGSTGVLICILDDAFPSRWCLAEIEAAIRNAVPIVTVFDMFKFNFEDVGKDGWREKLVNGLPIPHGVIQKVFSKGTIYFNSHPSYVRVAEQEFQQKALRLLRRHRSTASVPRGVSPVLGTQTDSHWWQWYRCTRRGMRCSRSTLAIHDAEVAFPRRPLPRTLARVAQVQAS